VLNLGYRTSNSYITFKDPNLYW